MPVGEFVSTLMTQDGGLIASLTILIAALLSARLIALPRDMQPMVWLGGLARALAHKVNKADRSSRQQRIAGTLAPLVLILPFWLIALFLLNLAAYPWFFEWLILYLCLADDSFDKVAPKVQLALLQGEKAKARELLAPYLVRDTRELSEVGITKASIEKLFSTPIYGIVATSVFFVIGGALLVLLVRMLKQLDLVWPAVATDFKVFSGPVNRLVSMLLYLPAWLWSLSLAIYGGPGAFKALTRPIEAQPWRNMQRANQVAAEALGIELGGPLRMNAERIVLNKFGHGPLPKARDIDTASRLCKRATFTWIGLLAFFLLAWTVLRYLNTL